MKSHSPIDLHNIAYQAMIERGFLPKFSPQVIKEIQNLANDQNHLNSSTSTKDLRQLLWSSIDNPDSLDLDQIEFCEEKSNGAIRILIGIADVDSMVTKHSAIDEHAYHNTTSVYTGVQTFPMLPEKLSNELTSLMEDADRLAIVIEFTIDGRGQVQASDVYQAQVRNYAKLDYESVGAWLAGEGPMPEKISKVNGLEDQVRLQNKAAGLLANLSRANGALDLETIEPKVVFENGQIVDLVHREKNLARQIIENFMITANGVMSLFLEAKGVARLQRIVRRPKRWDRIRQLVNTLGSTLPKEPDVKALSNFLIEQRQKDPQRFPDLSLAIIKLLGAGEYAAVKPEQKYEGHFGLAVEDYTHSTAPNRRYPDLIMQRLVKAMLNKTDTPYQFSQLKDIADHCTEREQAAKKVERFMRKVAAAVLLEDRIGQIFDAIVTGVNDSGTYVRLVRPPAEGRLMVGEAGIDVGDKIRVRLLSVDPLKGYIDFARA